MLKSKISSDCTKKKKLQWNYFIVKVIFLFLLFILKLFIKLVNIYSHCDFAF